VKKETKEKICVALDVEDSRKARVLVRKLSDYVGFFKIGFQLFTSEGPKIVRSVQDNGGRVFLDLKYHDIPNTAASASVAAMKLGAAIINLHASGGFDMMSSVAISLKKKSLDLQLDKPITLAVTVLTSLNRTNLNHELRIPGAVEEQVVHLAKLAKKAGLDGVVASPLEIKKIRKACGGNFVILTPGIRPAWAGADDQKRIMTPKEAIDAGADIIVIGRPIIAAKNPADAARRVLDEIEQ
jgi:orotidine-5'-phosphate decarboxylase